MNSRLLRDVFDAEKARAVSPAQKAVQRAIKSVHACARTKSRVNRSITVQNANVPDPSTAFACCNFETHVPGTVYAISFSR